MKKIVAIVLIVIGLAMIAYTGFNYVTKEKVVDLGAIEMNAEKNHTIKWPPYVGVILIVGGIVILATGKKGHN